MTELQIQRPTLGAVAISRNEEVDMPGFLEHLLPWIDEIVIVDDGSTDSTIEIIRSAGPKVKLIEHRMDPEGGFATQRNLGIEGSESDWLIHMDIDERVPSQLATEILRSIRMPDMDAFRFRRLNFFLHRPMRVGGWQNWNEVHLAKRESLRFRNPLHETPELSCSAERVGQLVNEMWHINDESYTERLSKSAQYSRFEGDRIASSNRNVSWYSLLIKPVARAVNAYFRYGGFRAGTLGLIHGVYTFSSTFNWYASAWTGRTGSVARPWRRR